MNPASLAHSFDPEEPVIEAIRDGDRHAFAELVRRQGRFVRSILLGVLGDRDRMDDVEQQVWTTFWQRIGHLRDVKRWRPWLYSLARNAAIDAGRDQQRRRRKLAAAAEVAKSADGHSPDSRLVGDERQREVLAAVLGLPLLYREPFVLRHVNGWSYQEISEAMGIPVDTVETRLTRARRLLREALQDKV